ncbi:hypothetical protein GMLC_35600 [Geomonas limicola]|uniref:DUF4124 domain-containing protein n=1 Tax=Geomonas limicola TaxID=2740186 RepID=A0A6V8NBT9_9BACT|nr:DUF4124 domain-containing protein [Geomonas limicola]GFO69981.1 hypothetical protein GMLC_35600 [Geomonas limicola]
MKNLLLFLLLFASSASAEIYTWQDRAGTAFYTNSLHEIPARYRARAKLLDVATGKKVPIPAGPSAGSPAPAGAAPAAVPVVTPVPAPVPQPAPPSAGPAQAGQPGSVQQLRDTQTGAPGQRPGYTIIPNNPAPVPAASSAPRVPSPKRARPHRVRSDDDE